MSQVRSVVVSSRAALVPLVFVVASLLYVQGNAYHQDLLMLMATYGLLALGMYIPFIMAGSLSLAYTVYLTVGGYSVAWISHHTDLPIVVGIVIGAVLSAVIAVILGFATRRLSSFYLAAVTLLFAEAFDTWLVDAEGITNGASGFSGVRSLTVLGVTIERQSLLVVAVLLVWVVAVGIDRLRRNPFGIAVRARHEIPVGVEATGVGVAKLTLITLAVGAAITSVGGALFVSYNGSVGPETFGLQIVLLAIFMPILGGKQTPWGAVLGAVIVVYCSFNFTWFEGTGTLAFAVAVLVALVLVPNGILGSLQRLKVAVVHRRRADDGPPAPPPDPAGPGTGPVLGAEPVAGDAPAGEPRRQVERSDA